MYNSISKLAGRLLRPTMSIKLLVQLLLLCGFTEANRLARTFKANPGDCGDLETKADDARSFRATCSRGTLEIEFFRADVVRLKFTPPDALPEPSAFEDLVVVKMEDLRFNFKVQVSQNVSHFTLKAIKEGDGAGPEAVTLIADKSPLRFSMWRGTQPLWSEAEPLSCMQSRTFQTMAAAATDRFFGGGMQHGSVGHRGRVNIRRDSDWNEGGHPNSAPFYLSTAGYGVFRSTWKAGIYDFTDPTQIVLSHEDVQFDAFYFASAPRDFAALLEGYTFITGRPFMIPIYALGLGDSNCYHNKEHGWNTEKVMDIAKEYRKEKIPAAWILPNDGYGCGFGVDPGAKDPRDFRELTTVSAELKQLGFEIGLWSSNASGFLELLKREVAGSGMRIAKTDVAWIGEGYKYAFDAVRQIAAGIEDNSDARRFIWTVEGWAGTHRYAVMWTGDNSGSWPYIEWQIPTFAGAGFSAQAHVSGDIDGIYGGSAETMIRDLQFKCFMTVLMTMGGWSELSPHKDKEPWVWGGDYTDIARDFLTLKSRLVPYFYTLSRIAFDSGLSPVRAMALEFPLDDRFILEPTKEVNQQFMAGPWFLVAPVYKALSETTQRDNIYLPNGDWVDWWNGAIVQGPDVISHPALLQTMPLFVRAGAIIPMWPIMQYPGELAPDPMTLEVFPSGESSFNLYEDDGHTRNALTKGIFTWTRMSCSAPRDAMRLGGSIVLQVEASVGSFEGAPLNVSERNYIVRIHLPMAPGAVLLQGAPMSSLVSDASATTVGWSFQASAIEGPAVGVLMVQTGRLKTKDGWRLEVSTATEQSSIGATAVQQAHAVTQSSVAISYSHATTVSVASGSFLSK